jgi:hypothetical protein
MQPISKGLEELTAIARSEQQASYVEHVNPILAKLLDVLDTNVQYTHTSGAELFTADGRTILDSLSGYCVHNTGHNHPYIVTQLIAELQGQSSAMLQSNVVGDASGSVNGSCTPTPRNRPSDASMDRLPALERRGSSTLSANPRFSRILAIMLAREICCVPRHRAGSACSGG